MMGQSLYYDDFHVGQKFVTKARTVTEADIVNFSNLSWDHNPLHTDAEYASRTMFGRPIAHGLLGLVMHAGLSYHLVEETLLAFLSLEWEFKLPIFVNDTIHVEQVVSEMRETSQKDRGVLSFQKELINQRREVVQTGKTVILLARRP
jgi:3-hydroxybutyryl-CoA dehydratase